MLSNQSTVFYFIIGHFFIQYSFNKTYYLPQANIGFEYE